MRTIFETCQPRKSILQGTFNPEVFTAALSPVIQFYRSGEAAIDSVYTDAETFFTEATYPTEGLRQTVSNVFRRISGDQTAPSIYRLETSFGGGKTHSLIACVHIANRGTELAPVGVHRVAAGDKGHHATGTHLVQSLGEKVVVNAEIQLVIGFIPNLILAKRNITHRQIIEIPPVGGLKPCHGDVGLAVTFQQVDDTPDAETSAEGDNEGLKNGDSLIEKCHIQN